MSLDVYLEGADGREIYWRNVTHNLHEMAEAAGIYMPIWRPDEVGITTAGHVADAIRSGVADLASNPAKYKQYNATNGWGKWEGFVAFCVDYLSACDQNRDALVRVSR